MMMPWYKRRLDDESAEIRGSGATFRYQDRDRGSGATFRYQDRMRIGVSRSSRGRGRAPSPSDTRAVTPPPTEEVIREGEEGENESGSCLS